MMQKIIKTHTIAFAPSNVKMGQCENGAKLKVTLEGAQLQILCNDYFAHTGPKKGDRYLAQFQADCKLSET